MKGEIMRINYINSTALAQLDKNTSFGHLTANVDKDFTCVKKALSSAKFDSYVKHFKYLQGFKLNLKAIMKNVDAMKYFAFNEIYPNLSKEQINNCAQKVINSFVKALGAKAGDFTMKFEPHPAKPVLLSTIHPGLPIRMQPERLTINNNQPKRGIYAGN